MISRISDGLSKRPVIVICRILLAAIFISASAGKLLNPSEFADSVAGFRILPISTVNIFSIVLPWIELLCGLSLLTGILMRSSGLLLAGLNLMFIVAAASALARGLSIECGCFTLSHVDDRVGWSLIARDLMFVLLCTPIILQGYRSSQTIASLGTTEAANV